MASEPKGTKSNADFIRRGIKKRSPYGTAVFVGLRFIDPLLQYGILARGLGSSLLDKAGIETLPAGPPNTGTILDSLGLSPYRLILLSMSTGTAIKQIVWLTAFSEEEFPPASAIAVTAFNSVFNAINTVAFICKATSASLSSNSQFPQTPLVIGSIMYTVGILFESYAEYDRKQFKKDPKNEGKVCSRGLWSIVRHPNYLGYTLWRTGFGLAAGGWTLGAFNLAYWLGDFSYRGIPSLDQYCSGRYGAQWDEYNRQTPYKIIPYVY